jgi:hypothetical protein
MHGLLRFVHANRLVGLTILTLAMAATAPSLESITLRSGNGPIGTLDPLVTHLPGPANTYMAPLNAADFAAAQAGAPGFIIGNHGAWIASLPADPVARYLSTSFGGAGEGGSALYCHPFTVTTSLVASASLTLYFSVDNVLGGNGNEGVYLNGSPVPGTTGGNFGGQHVTGPHSVGHLLQPGLNHLYVVANDLGGPGGVMFSAQLEIEPGQVVEARETAASFHLGEAWPNPFNPVTVIPFELDETSSLRLVVHDLAGREVAVLHDGLAARGAHRVSYDASGLPAGIYFYTLQTALWHETRKLLLVK